MIPTINSEITINPSVSLKICSVLYGATFKLGRLLTEAVNTLYSMKDYRSESDSKAFSAVVSMMCKNRPAIEAQSFFDSLKDNFELDVGVYTSLIRVWCRERNMDGAERVFNDMMMAGIRPTAYTYSILIDALCGDGQITRAHDVFAEMLDSGCEPKAVTFNNLMRNNLMGVRAKSGGIGKVLDLYQQMKAAGIQPTRDTYSFVIDAICRCDHISCARKVFAEMVDSGCKPTALTFNKLMSVHVKPLRMEEVLQLYDQMKTIGIQPTAYTYNIIIDVLCRCGQITRAHDMFTEMFGSGCKPSAHTFNKLISIYAHTGRMEKVLHLYDQMKTVGILPIVRTYNIVIDTLCRCGQITRAHEMLTEMLVSASKPMARTFYNLMWVHLKARRMEKTLQLYDQMKTAGIQPSGCTYKIIVYVLWRCGLITRACDLLFEMLGSACKASAVIFNKWMSVHHRAGRMKKMLQLYKQMETYKIPPTEDTLIYALYALRWECRMLGKKVKCLTKKLMWHHGKAGRTENVLQLYNEMKIHGIQPDKYICDIVVETLCKCDQIPCALAETLVSGEPDVVTYNLLIYTLCLNNNRAMAIKVLKLMSKKGCEPNTSSFDPLFVCDACNGDINSAYRLFLRMKQAGCRPSTDTYNILMQILEESKSADMAVKMWIEMAKVIIYNK